LLARGRLGRQSVSNASGFQALLDFFPISQMSPHQCFPELAVIGDREMEQFVDDDVIAELRIHVEQFVG
jgi:hypothetical protein